MKKYIIGSAAVLEILVGVISLERIPAGYVGVVYSPTNGVEKEVWTQGFDGVTNLTIMDSTNTMKVLK